MQQFLFLIIALFVVITIHEFAHAWTANMLGDPTAKRMGRVSLNPLKHIDPLGFVMIFLIGIGWGKPVPVNPSYFKKPKSHEALVALAGPVSNLIIALIIVIPLKYLPGVMPFWLDMLLEYIFEIAIVLFVFNMLPFPPLDGSKFLQIIIPKKWARSYDYYLAHASLYFVLFLVLDNFIFRRYFGFSILGSLIDWVIVGVKSLVFLGS